MDVNAKAVRDLQAGVIGSMLIWPEKLAGQIISQLEADDFPNPTMRRIFTACREVFLERQLLDPLLVQARLGPEYDETLAASMTAVPTSANWALYVDELRKQRKLRDIQAAAFRITNAIDLPEAQAMLSEAAQLLIDSRSARESTLEELFDAYLDRQSDPKPTEFLHWGIEPMDKQLRVRPGRFIVLAADSSVGKTALALQFAFEFSKAGHKVGFFSYETDRDDAGDRMVSNIANVQLRKGQDKALTQGDVEHVRKTKAAVRKLPFSLIEVSHYTVSDVRAKTLARGFDTIIVDYVQMIPAKGNNPAEQVRSISMDLHALSQELGVTVLGLSQVTVPETDRNGRRRPISSDDLRESRQLKMDAEVILLLDLSDPTDRDSPRSLRVAKNKQGSTGYFMLNFDAPHMRFTYLPTYEEAARAEKDKRFQKMDAKRETRRVEAQAKAAAEAAQVRFEELPDDGEKLPF